MKQQKCLEVVSVPITAPDGEEARFSISIIGIPLENMQLIGSSKLTEGSAPIKTALSEQRNSEGVSLLEAGYRPISLFHLAKVPLSALQPIRRSSLANDFE